jgi:hypothetical protein
MKYVGSMVIMIKRFSMWMEAFLTNPGKVDYGELVRSFAFYGSVGLSNILYVLLVIRN